MSARPPIRVALMGARGIPARYGGYETLLEEITPRLVSRGFDVTVYCRSYNTPRDLSTHLGASLVRLPTVRSKYLDTPVHTLLTALHSVGHRYDAALVVNSANAIFVPLIRFGRTPVALHVDGIEKRRAKWGWLGRQVYAISERLAGRVSNVVVSDADVIRRHYANRYGVESVMITYGVDPIRPDSTETLDRLGLEPNRYILYVSRFEPENNPHRVVAGYGEVATDVPLVMVGDAPYADDLIRAMRRDADPRVLFPGGIYGVGYRELLSNAMAYVHATEVGGTHPALVEAMGYGNCVVVNDTPENREVAGDAGRYFQARELGSLARALREVLDDPEKRSLSAARAAEIAGDRFDWERVADRYAELFVALASRASTAADRSK